VAPTCKKKNPSEGTYQLGIGGKDDHRGKGILVWIRRESAIPRRAQPRGKQFVRNGRVKTRHEARGVMS